MRLSFLLLLISAAAAIAQAPPPRFKFVVSPEVHPDRTVTFRLYAPEAQAVRVVGEWNKEDALAKDEGGVWSATIGPLDSELYGYSFKVDGVTMLDPSNTFTKPSRSVVNSGLRVPGDIVAPIDYAPGAARGTVHLHDYDSKSLGRVRHLRVYTPPGFDPKSDARYPILYLLHGSGDNEAVWTEFGRANVILDNLIAAQKAVPMICVMPDGHAAGGGSPDQRGSNDAAFSRDFVEDVVPFIEARYPIKPAREQHAIAGLSMGGNHAFIVGLNHRDQFAWVAGMSSGIRDREKPLESFWADPVSARYPLRLLWISIGKDDYLLKDNQAFDAMLTERKVPHEYTETPGSHRWMVWRRNLAELAPRLFKDTDR